MFTFLNRKQAFTLIELSIVLVIIGLIVGGVLVGRDLIAAANVRAQISQIEKYQQAVNTFKGKFGALPGDIPEPDATRFGFRSRGGNRGAGDGNALLEGLDNNYVSSGTMQRAGETVMFWVDLSQIGYIDGNFTSATPSTAISVSVTGSGLNQWFPQGKLGNNAYLYTYSQYGINYFGLSGIVSNNAGCGNCLDTKTVTSVAQARAIDEKIDDGLPQSGNVLALFVNRLVIWPRGDGFPGASPGSPGWNDPSSCYGNNNTTDTHTYSISVNRGLGLNCALSFKFQ